MGQRNRKLFIVTSLFAAAAAAPLASTQADPLPGETLKFQQLPLFGVTVSDTTGTSGTFNGHDELSTAYLNAATQTYQGGFMADDFADLVSTPVVHVKWWGSYPGTVGAPAAGANVTQFLIAFESDVPAGTGGIAYSRPGSVLQAEVVTLGALSPASGTFTETLEQAPPGGENLYRYNAELALPFAEQANTVYWLKIVALDSSGVVPGPVVWGWHNRDYTVQDTLASVNPQVIPGESDLQPTIDPNYPSPVWHFQDDAIRGQLSVQTLGVPSPIVIQNPASFAPSIYIDGIDGLGPSLNYGGISQFSQDLAFELYTAVPEPASLSILAIGAVLVTRRRRSAAVER